MIYAWRYPKRIHRSVMIGVNPPGKFLWDAKTTGEQIRRYAALCAKDAACHARTPDLAASLHSAFGTSRPLLVPAGQAGQRQGGRVLRPEQRDRRRRRRRSPAPKTIDTLLSAGKGDGSGAWFLSLMAQIASRTRRSGARSPRSDAATRPPPGASSRRTPTAARSSAPRHGSHLGRRPPPERVAGEPGREPVHARPRLERRDAADRRPARLRDAAAERDARVAAAPAERPPGRPPRYRTRRRLLGLRAEGEQPSRQHVPRQRPSRHLALHAEHDRVHAERQPRRDREDPPRRHALVRSADGAVAAVAAVPRPPARRDRAEVERGCSARSTSSCSGWAAGSRACSSPGDDADLPLDDDRLATISVGVPIGLGIYFAWVNRDWSAPHEGVRFHGRGGGRARRRVARLPRARRSLRSRHHDRRSGGRRQPDGSLAGHRMGSQGPRSLRSARRCGDPRASSVHRLRTRLF